MLSKVQQKAFVTAVKPFILAVWNEIASDVIEASGDDNEQALECCIDADRIAGLTPMKKSSVMFDHMTPAQADHLIKKTIDEMGYQSVLKLLSDNIRLV